MSETLKFKAIDIYETPADRVRQTGQRIYVAKDLGSGTYCLGVISANDDGEIRNAYAILCREDLTELRDALNREFAS